jgi:hypothetical protein
MASGSHAAKFLCVLNREFSIKEKEIFWTVSAVIYTRIAALIRTNHIRELFAYFKFIISLCKNVVAAVCMV